MLNVALTGNVAAGKTTVARFLAEWGATIIDADAIVRELQAPGSPLLQSIAAAFGPDVLTPDGELDRAEMRARILEDVDARTRLNAIVHPAVHERRAELETEALAAGATVVVNDIPLLFEVMDPSTFPVVILVDADEAIRRDRLLARGLREDEAAALMSTQMDPALKRSGATHIIENNGTLEELRERTRDVWKDVCDRAAHQLDRG